MNYIKAIFLTILIVLGIGISPAVSQVGTGSYTMTQVWGAGGTYLYMTTGSTYLDTTSTYDTTYAQSYWTNWFDATPFDGVTTYAIYDFATPGGTADTVRVVIEGTVPEMKTVTSGVNTYAYGVVDTVLCIGDAVGNRRPRTNIVTALSPIASVAGYFPMWRLRFRVTGPVNVTRRGTFKFALYAPTNDVVPPFKEWGKHY